jgi:hypothetical protein
MKKLSLPLAAAALVFAVAVGAPAQAQVRTGLLECQVAPGVSYLIGSNKEVACHYTSARRGRHERYIGRIGRLGVDVGFTSGGTLAWAVYAAGQPGPGVLGGSYIGASAEATVGAGISANALVGGFNNTITLQPISVGTQTGLDAALTASSLTLEPVAGRGGKRKHHRRH